MYIYQNAIGDRVQVVKRPGTADSMNFGGMLGEVLSLEYSEEDDRDWPECLVRFDAGYTARVLDYNLRAAA
jgi:hypothetical protein